MDGEITNQEINLTDFVRVIIRRKWLVVFIFILAMSVGLAYTFLSQKVYRVETVIEVGLLNGDPIEATAQLAEKIINDIYGSSVRQKLNISETDYLKIKTEAPSNTALVKVKIETAKTERAVKILSEIANLIIAEHQAKIEAAKTLIEQNIETIEGKIKLVESDIEKVRNKISPLESDIKRIENKIVFMEEEKTNLVAKIEALEKVLPYEQTPGDQFALFDAKEKLALKKQEIEDLYLEINNLKKEKEDLNLAINSLKGQIENHNAEINSLKSSLVDIRFTQTIKAPTTLVEPIRPKPFFDLALAVFGGLFLAVFLAFVREWWEKNRQKLSFK